MSARNRNEVWGRTVADELARHGVRHVVVSPGSRSTPLVLAVAEDPRLRVRVQLDERSAGFFAVGVGKASDHPAAVVTTSGTAVANLLPAVVEAAQSEVPLLLLTADRPPRLRGADANQTIQQIGIFGGYVRRFEELPNAEVTEPALRHARSAIARAMAAALGDPAGPVHLNLPFAKPLEPTPVEGDVPTDLASGDTLGAAGRPDERPWTSIEPVRVAPSAPAVAEVAEAIRRSERPLVVAGVLPRPDEAGPTIVEASRALGVPVLADALSGARYAEEPGGPEGADGGGAVVVGGYDIALRSAGDALRPDLVLRFGASPTSAVLGTWLSALDDIPHVVVDGGGRWKDHAAMATSYVPADPVRFLDALLREDLKAGPDPSWLARWRTVESGVREAIRARSSSLAFEGSVVAEVVRRVHSEDLLFVSSSMPVRDLDTFVPGRERPLSVRGNRGASGIDGIVSTAAGSAVGMDRRVVALVGDLALLHDSNGLAFLREAGIRVLLVVINNDGGGIFHLLPIREIDPPFTSLFATPHGRNLGLLAELHGLPHVVVDLAFESGDAELEAGAGSPGALAELEEAWAAACGWAGSGILEIRTDRARNHERRTEAIREIADRVAVELS